MTRIVLGIEYDGSGFSGWQWQTHQRSVQQVLEQALSKVAAHRVTVQCAEEPIPVCMRWNKSCILTRK